MRDRMPSTTTATAESSPSSWAALGCYSDILPMHILEKQVSEEGGDKTLTIAKCQSACHLARLKYVDLKAGNEIWCSSSVAGELAKNKTDCNNREVAARAAFVAAKTASACSSPFLVRAIQRAPSKAQQRQLFTIIRWTRRTLEISAYFEETPVLSSRSI